MPASLSLCSQAQEHHQECPGDRQLRDRPTPAWPERCLVAPCWPSHLPGGGSESPQPWAAPRFPHCCFTTRELRHGDRHFSCFLLFPSRFLCVFASLGLSEESWPAVKLSLVACARGLWHCSGCRLSIPIFPSFPAVAPGFTQHPCASEITSCPLCLHLWCLPRMFHTWEIFRPLGLGAPIASNAPWWVPSAHPPARGLLPPCLLGLPKLLRTHQALFPALPLLPSLPLNRGAPQLLGLWVRT